MKSGEKNNSKISLKKLKMDFPRISKSDISYWISCQHYFGNNEKFYFSALLLKSVLHLMKNIELWRVSSISKVLIFRITYAAFHNFFEACYIRIETNLWIPAPDGVTRATNWWRENPIITDKFCFPPSARLPFFRFDWLARSTAVDRWINIPMTL